MALSYFYCCLPDPHVAISNDELQPDFDGSVTWNRISNLIGSTIGREEAMLSRNIQQPWPITCKNHCLCILLQTPFECRWSTRNCWDENRWFAFRVPSNRIVNRMLDCIVIVHQNHIQVVNHNGTFYHLNPDLVFDVNQIKYTWLGFVAWIKFRHWFWGSYWFLRSNTVWIKIYVCTDKI